MFIGVYLLVVVAGARASGWRWPDEARSASVRIDTKVRFVDDDSRRPNRVQADEIKPPVETEGFYNRPEGAGSGRYPVHSAPQRLTWPQSSDGTLDSLQYCKCVENAGPGCHSPNGLPRACSSGMQLCCYKRPHRTPHDRQSEIFSELEDERPMLLPNYEKRTGPFNASPEESPHIQIGSLKPSGASDYQNTVGYKHTHSILFGPMGPLDTIDPNHRDNRIVVGPNQRNPGVLVGPDGPTGLIGPNHRDNRLIDGTNQRNPAVIVGPDGPTEVIGPNPRGNRLIDGTNQRNPAVLVGPDGPTGVIGPSHRDNKLIDGTNQRNPGILVGPDGPTGIVGPNNHEDSISVGPNHRNPGVLVGPSGPTGNIGPHDSGSGDISGPHGAKKFNPGVLVGPGGPTGQIGPHHRDDRGPTGFLRPNQQSPGILAGPDGDISQDDYNPWVLVGPGGPTGGYGPDQHKQGVHSSSQSAESAQVLVGPGGPTGIIGPGGRRGRWQGGPGLLVGPGGPTGIIGPGRRLLVGPGGPTGRLGPRGYGQYGF